ncbi:MAG: DUF4097 family beta strand repeat protein [Clostridia bacterium]|nr:DUF4097 family beta strand repeat protein [Clostridia bacterium]
MNKKKPALTVILIALCMILLGCAVRGTPIGNYSYDSASRYRSGSTSVSGRVNALDVSWVDGRVTIGYHNGDEVVLSETSARKLTEKTELHWLLDGGTLYVKYAESGLRLSSNLDKELTVLLPEGLQLKDAKITAVSADVDVEDFAADTIHFDTVSGDAQLDIASAKKLTAGTVSGEVTVTADRVDEVKADAVSGDMRLYFARTPEKITADSVSGDVILRLPGNAGFTADVDTVSGRVSGSLPMEKQGKNRYVCGNGSCNIRVDTVSGSVQLDK